jgi:hypothetical protein
MEKQYRLPKEFAENWVKALRSGEYTQGSNFMFNNFTNTYCCLGVACEVAGHDLKLKTRDELKVSYISSLHYDDSSVPTELSFDPEFQGELVNMNDSGDYSFSDIADWIEENVTFY